MKSPIEVVSQINVGKYEEYYKEFPFLRAFYKKFNIVTLLELRRLPQLLPQLEENEEVIAASTVSFDPDFLRIVSFEGIFYVTNKRVIIKSPSRPKYNLSIEYKDLNFKIANKEKLFNNLWSISGPVFNFKNQPHITIENNGDVIPIFFKFENSAGGPFKHSDETDIYGFALLLHDLKNNSKEHLKEAIEFIGFHSFSDLFNPKGFYYLFLLIIPVLIHRGTFIYLDHTKYLSIDFASIIFLSFFGSIFITFFITVVNVTNGGALKLKLKARSKELFAKY